MGTTERRQRQKEEVYDSILKAAWKLVKEEGWQKLSLRKIAEAIEYSIPVIYDHFENKEAILKEFTKRGFSALNDELRIAIASEIHPVAKLKAVTYAYWNFAFDNKEYYQLMYGMGMPSCETVNELAEVREFTEILIENVSGLYQDQQISAQESLIKMKGFWSMLHGLVSIHMMNVPGARQDADTEVLDELVTHFLAGINKSTNN